MVHSIGLSSGGDSDRFFFKNYQVAAIVILFAANNTILQQVENFFERNLFESIQNAQQAMHTKFGSDICNISKFIRFAAKNTILQHYASNHHFSREKLF